MDIRKLQRAIDDGLEDVKAQHIVVFDTEVLSPLFERVIIASGTSNRQTKALASSVRDAVKAIGEPVPRTEGEENGEWIIVDCGAAVAHIMQPAIRDYYRLEEIWGDKPVHLRRAARKGLPKAAELEPAAAPAKKGAAPRQAAAPARAARKTSTQRAPAKTAARAVAKAATKAPAGRGGRQASRQGASQGSCPDIRQARGSGGGQDAQQGLNVVRLLVLAVGQRQPAWAEAAWDDYAKRFPAECRLEIKAIKAEPREGRTAARCLGAEAVRLDAALPKGVRLVVLDERGQRRTTRELAERLQVWLGDGRDVALMIGGPDGLDPSLKARADETLRLSDLTLPHAMVRVILAEALYRAWSLHAGHPYHRE